MKQFDYSKMNGKVMAVIQDNQTNLVLHAGLMDERAVEVALSTDCVHLTNTIKDPLFEGSLIWPGWNKIVEVLTDCDNDTLLFKVKWTGETLACNFHKLHDEPGYFHHLWPCLLDFKLYSGYVIAIIQDFQTQRILMVGVMDKQALMKTLETNKITFYSRKSDKLWTKGETSGNFLNLESLSCNCDAASLLFQVNPLGPTCHRGTFSCFD